MICGASGCLMGVILACFNDGVVGSTMRLDSFVDTLTSSSMTGIAGVLDRPTAICCAIAACRSCSSMGCCIGRGVGVCSSDSQAGLISGSSIIDEFAEG